MERYLYDITFSAEDSDTASVEMTEQEANLFDRIITEANSQVCGWCGSCSIDLDSKR